MSINWIPSWQTILKRKSIILRKLSAKMPENSTNEGGLCEYGYVQGEILSGFKAF
jgi:hypothetical protein